MDANKILNSSVLDLIFENRNKEYGAYDLRKTYNKRMKIALLVTFLVVVLFIAGFLLSLRPKAENHAVLQVQDVNIQQYNKPPPPKPKAPPPPPPPKAAPPKIEMQKFTTIKIVKDAEIKPNEQPPKQDEKITIGPVTQHGLNMSGALSAPPEVKGIGGNGKGPGSGSGSGSGDYEGEFTSVQVEATYPGGPSAWQKYLQRNLNQQLPVDNGAPPGQYAVVVSFVVSKDGSTSEVKVQSSPKPDYGTGAEAVRVIERSGKWNPAIQNGRKVTYRQTQRIIFIVPES